MACFRHIWLGLILFVAGGLGAAAAGETVPGQSDPAFVDSVAAWLDGPEEDALPALAELARADNAAAQLLLALIDKTPALQGPWLARLPRSERVALMRADGGLSGASWVHAAAGQSAHAALWQRLWRADAPASLGLDFARAGEVRAAREAFIYAALREAGGLGELVSDPDFPAAVRFLAHPDGAEVDAGALHPGDPQRRALGAGIEAAHLGDWLATAPEALPARALCEARCSDDVAACTLAATGALGSHPALLMLGSPSEALIDPERFARSARGQTSFLRRAILSTDARGRQHLIKRLQVEDACFAEQVVSEIERFRAQPVPRSE
ncbi:MAG: hypothetical protein JJU42_14190 [Rhodobacteraceae bacterium]|nr:hypothetical protein [Paracoccaceae bacterium]